MRQRVLFSGIAIERPRAGAAERQPASFWSWFADRVGRWCAEEDAVLREVVVLLPFAQLLVPARAAFAARGAWMPRIETTATLAAVLAPGRPVDPPQLTLDPVLDALTAEALLRGERWAADWARRDPRDFDAAVQRLTATATALARAAAACPPNARDAWLAAGRERLHAGSGSAAAAREPRQAHADEREARPGARERALARIAFEWAALGPAPATDALFGCRPAAWVVLQAGGIDPLVAGMTEAADVPVLVIDADPPPGDPLAARPASARGVEAGLELAVCDDFEDEAQRCAASVLAHVQRGEVPVALIAQDRLLVRRVRALLERHHIEMRDETGWKLSTTRAGAELMQLLLAASADATTDALIDWLKTAGGSDPAVDALEAACRKGGFRTIAQLARHGEALNPPSVRLLASAASVLAPLTDGGARPLSAWLDALDRSLAAAGTLDRLGADAAGRQVLGLLRLGDSAPSAGPAASRWQEATRRVEMDATRFRVWVDRTLERQTFRPEPTPGVPPEVVVVPLAGAMLRPFAAAVLGGADERQLGVAPASTGLLSEADARALGVPTATDRRDAEALAFAHLLALPQVGLLRRRHDGGEPLGPSPLLDRLEAALVDRGVRLATAPERRIERRIGAAPVPEPNPAAAERLPASLSASACEALRACPYRFFALHLLGLGEADELDRGVEKRDYGTWLHAVLNRFHRDRDPTLGAAADLERLVAVAAEPQPGRPLDPVDFVPFAASFAGLAPAYVAWTRAEEAAGRHWSRGEERIDARFEALGATGLHGVLDRIDRIERSIPGDGPGFALIDYKSGSVDRLKAQVREPLEDTQLAFYAALMRSQTAAPLTAMYLPVDGSERLKPVRHPEVAASADALVDGLGEDLRRLRAGAGLPALGDEEACTHCAARGICRRDDRPARRPAAPVPASALDGRHA